MTLNRTLAPSYKPITGLPFPEYEELTLAGGTKVYLIPYGLQPVLGLELVFNAGKCCQQQNGVSAFTGELITEGTKQRTGYQIAQETDRYGAYLNVETGVDFSTVSLHTLDCFFQPVSDVLTDVLKNAVFAEDEFKSKYERTCQNIEVEEQKTGWQAKKIFLASLFGAEHPYSSTTGKEELKALNVDLLKNFYAQYYNPARSFVVVSGLFDRNKILDYLYGLYEGVIASSDEWGQIPQELSPNKGLVVHEMPDNLQSSVRVGHLAFKRSHPDIYKMRVTNTVLGGYFGSRLMQNIREEKGYTYGIGSAWVSNKEGGYFTIAADVGQEVTKDTLRQIRIELERMRQEKVSSAELEVVKNYMLGRIASEMETPFQLADRLKHAIVYGISKDEMNLSFDSISSTTADDVLEMAQRYFDIENLLEVVGGKI